MHVILETLLEKYLVRVALGLSCLVLDRGQDRIYIVRQVLIRAQKWQDQLWVYPCQYQLDQSRCKEEDEHNIVPRPLHDFYDEHDDWHDDK